MGKLVHKSYMKANQLLIVLLINLDSDSDSDFVLCVNCQQTTTNNKQQRQAATISVSSTAGTNISRAIELIEWLEPVLAP